MTGTSLYEPEPHLPGDADRRAIGVLLANVGTPAAPTAKALRRYLRQFLSDTRIAEAPRWKWLPILYLFVLTTRPQRVAKLYQKIWTDEGSPLLAIGNRQVEGIAARLRQRRRDGEPPFHVALGMRYGEPSIRSALAELRRKGCTRLLFFPLFPQYSAATTASTIDMLAKQLRRWRWVPELRTINSYYDDPGFLRSLAASIRETWEHGEPDRLVLSYHGVPQRYVDNGDPYQCQCLETTRLLVEELGIDEERVLSTFQSQFGRELWIRPKTDVAMRELPEAGLKNVDIACPGFSADCIETLEEIEVESRGYFEESGGERLRYIPCLNDRPDHLDALANLILKNTREWRRASSCPQHVAGKAAGMADRLNRLWEEFSPAPEREGWDRLLDSLLVRLWAHYSDVDEELAVDNLTLRRTYVTETPMLTAAEIHLASGLRSRNTSEPASRWKAEGKTFALRMEGRNYYPAFQFEDGSPRPAVGAVLAELPATITPWQTALWFASANGWLDGDRPQDRLDDDALVVQAARRLAEPAYG